MFFSCPTFLSDPFIDCPRNWLHFSTVSGQSIYLFSQWSYWGKVPIIKRNLSVLRKTFIRDKMLFLLGCQLTLLNCQVNWPLGNKPGPRNAGSAPKGQWFATHDKGLATTYLTIDLMHTKTLTFLSLLRFVLSMLKDGSYDRWVASFDY